ncbi:MAG: CHRD domain-containing protein [Myxococcales bacterium]|nr:CHRD domain-containing protein [Myxococcales bacterium]
MAVCCAASFACGGSSSSNNYAATLAGPNEVPATTSTATGTATVTVNGATANYTVTYSGLSGPPTASHIHVGSSTVAGPVVVPFSGLPTTASGTFNGSFTSSDIQPQSTPVVVVTLDDLVNAMKAGNAYVNIHTTANKGGEIRGQLHAQ